MSQPTSIRIDRKPCCADCENPVHRLLDDARPRLTDEQYQRLLRGLRRLGVSV